MFAATHPHLKNSILQATLDIFPEARAVILWGGCLGPDFSPRISDVDLIIEVDASIRDEVTLMQRLKSLVAACKDCVLDPFLFLPGMDHSEEIVFLAPFGTYMPNPFISYLVKDRSETILGESQLLPLLAPQTLAEALAATLPAALGAVLRVRHDFEGGEPWSSLLAKHRAGFLLMLRTVYTLAQQDVAAKKVALHYFAAQHPSFTPITSQLELSIDPLAQVSVSAEPPSELITHFLAHMQELLSTHIKQNKRYSAAKR